MCLRRPNSIRSTSSATSKTPWLPRCVMAQIVSMAGKTSHSRLNTILSLQTNPMELTFPEDKACCRLFEALRENKHLGAYQHVHTSASFMALPHQQLRLLSMENSTCTDIVLGALTRTCYQTFFKTNSATLQPICITLNRSSKQFGAFDTLLQGLSLQWTIMLIAIYCRTSSLSPVCGSAGELDIFRPNVEQSWCSIERPWYFFCTVLISGLYDS